MEGKKKILFMLGVNELAEHKDVLIEAVRRRLDIFSENADKLDVDLCFYPADRKQWLGLNPGLAESLFEMLEKAKDKGISITEISPKEGEQAAQKYDAYYGSPSFMPLFFTGSNKPVMIADLGI